MPYRKIFPEVYDSSNPLVFMGQASRPALGETLSILVWNIYKARKSGWQDDFLKLIRNKDLVLLQESVLNNHDNSIFEKIALHKVPFLKSCLTKGNRSKTLTLQKY